MDTLSLYLATSDGKEVYTKWADRIDHDIDFSLKASPIHTKAHEKKVLLFSLMIAEKRKLSKSDMEILGAASAFHDTRRLNDGPDVGHGLRGAKHYKEWAESRHVPFQEASYTIMAFHDRDDPEGVKVMKQEGTPGGVLLYDIFKDADGLDRYRISPYALDEKFLRTKEAISLMDLSKKLNGLK